MSAVKETISAPAIIKTEDRSALVAAYRRFLYNGELGVARPHTDWQRYLARSGRIRYDLQAGIETSVPACRNQWRALSQGETWAVLRLRRYIKSDAIRTEGSSVGASVDPVFSSFTALSTDSGVSILKASWQMLQDAAFDMQNFISVITEGGALLVFAMQLSSAELIRLVPFCLTALQADYSLPLPLASCRLAARAHFRRAGNLQTPWH